MRTLGFVGATLVAQPGGMPVPGLRENWSVPSCRAVASARKPAYCCVGQLVALVVPVPVERDVSDEG